MQDRFGWCFIGSGSITERVLKDFPYTEGAYLASVYSRNYENAKALAERHGAKAYARMEDAIGDAAVRAVYIATTNNAHKEQAIAAMRLGKPVLCEKPFGLNCAQSAEMIEAARAERVYLMEGMWIRFKPVIRKALSWLEEGRIGAPRGLTATFSFQAEPHRARLFDPALGGGSLLDLGVYTLSLARFVFGCQPKAMRAIADIGETGVDRQCAMMLQYESGAIARLFSGLDYATDGRAILYGERGRIEIPNFVLSSQCQLVTASGAETFDPKNPGEGYQYEFDAVMRDIREGRLENEWIPHAHTLDIMATMDDVRKTIGMRYPGE